LLRFLGTCLRTLLFWLGLFEALAWLRRWAGLSWLGEARWTLLPLAAGLLRSELARPGRLAAALSLTAAPALLLQIGAASLRGAALNPLRRLRPGDHGRYRVEPLDIPMSSGRLPGLHIVPAGGARAAVCVVHGSGCNKTSYVWRLVDLLTGCGAALLLIDMDGHGENPRPQSFPAILEDVGAAVGWMRGRYARVGVLGISLGGCLAARSVAEGTAVDALAVLEAPPKLSFGREDILREAAALAQPRLLDIFCDCTPLNLYRAWESPPIRATVSTWDLIDTLDLLGSLGRVRAPLLLLYGGRDAIVKPAQAEQVRRAMPPGATFRMVPGASHLTLILSPPALEQIRRWAEQHLLS